MNITKTDFDTFADEIFANGVKTLGTLCWFSISDVRIGADAVNRMAKNSGLDSNLKRKPASDAFRVATTECLKNSGVVTSHSERLIIRSVKDNASTIIKAIVVETVNAAGETLDHYVAGRIRFDREKEQITEHNEGVTGSHCKMVHELSLQVESDYKDFRNRLTAGELRRWMMGHLKEMCYLKLLPGGGAYFVPSFNNDILRNLKEFVSDLSEATNTKHTFGVLPVPDVSDQRELVTRSFVESFEDETKELLGDIADMLAKGEEITARAAKTRLARIRETIGRAAEYRTHLNIANADIDERLVMLEVQAVEIMDRKTA